MKKSRIRNTSDLSDECNLLSNLLTCMESDGIERQEKQGQKELIYSSQLPLKWGCNSDRVELFKQYEKMGIKIDIAGIKKDDNLFIDVELPEGWSKQSTEHAMWSNLIDDKGRIRAQIFYKAAFYDREAFINFSPRYSYDFINYLPQDEKGYYDIIKVKRKIDRDEIHQGFDDRYRRDIYIYYEDMYEATEEKGQGKSYRLEIII